MFSDVSEAFKKAKAVLYSSSDSVEANSSQLNGFGRYHNYPGDDTEILPNVRA